MAIVKRDLEAKRDITKLREEVDMVHHQSQRMDEVI